MPHAGQLGGDIAWPPCALWVQCGVGPGWVWSGSGGVQLGPWAAGFGGRWPPPTGTGADSSAPPPYRPGGSNLAPGPLGLVAGGRPQPAPGLAPLSLLRTGGSRPGGSEAARVLGSQAVAAAPSTRFGNGAAPRCWHCVYPDRLKPPF
jgi:hypothetical protein